VLSNKGFNEPLGTELYDELPEPRGHNIAGTCVAWHAYHVKRSFGSLRDFDDMPRVSVQRWTSSLRPGFKEMGAMRCQISLPTVSKVPMGARLRILNPDPVIKGAVTEDADGRN
jgi:hypothetical protein